MARLSIVSILLIAIIRTEGKKLILDVDGAIEDFRAVVLAVRSEPKHTVLAITCSNSYLTSHQCTLNINRALRLLGREDIPIYKGSNQALIARERVHWPTKHGVDGLGDLPNLEPHLLEDIIVAEEHASLAMARLAAQHKGEITVICTGPLTNLALAQKLDPQFGSNIREVFMNAGNLFGVGMVPSHPAAEYNVHMDPEAAYVVLTEFPAPLLTVPIETTSERQSSEMYGILSAPIRKEAFLERNTTVSEFLYKINQELIADSRRKGKGFAFWDEIPVAAALDSSVVTRSKAVTAAIELRGENTRGQLAIDWINKGSRRNLHIITEYSESAVARMMIKAVENFEQALPLKKISRSESTESTRSHSYYLANDLFKQ